MKPLVACYIRVSTDEQAEHGISIPAQKSRLAAYCQAQGWEIYDFFIDDGYSGKDLKRPAVQRMITGAANKFFDIVLVLKLDRLSRRQKDVLYLLEDIFEPNNIGFKSATESFDTTNAFGKASLGMMAVFAQLERDTIIERVRLAKKESAKQGRFMGGPAPYGYRYNYQQKSLEIDLIQAQTVKWLYQKYREESHGYSYLAKKLELDGIPGPTNRFWNKQSIRKILTNPVYAGYVKHQGKLYEGSHKSIIQPVVWHEVQVLIQSKGTRAINVNNGLLSGIIWCGECGARMRSKNVWQNHPCTEPKRVVRYYVCYSQDNSAKHMVKDPSCRCGYKNAEEIEEKVIQQIQHYKFDQAFLNEVIADVLINDFDNTATLLTITSAKKEMSVINKKINRWYEAFEEDILDSEQLQARIKDLKDKKLFLEQNINELENQLTKQAPKDVSKNEIIELIKAFPILWAEALPDEHREIILNLVKKIIIYADGRTELEFYI